MPPLRLAPLVAGLALQLGCGVLLSDPPEPIVAHKLPEPPRDDVPKSWVYAGEIRDHASLRLEPQARIEYWSEDPDYAPSVKLDGRGGFSVRVDACKRVASATEELFDGILFAEHSTCRKWIGRLAVRARLGRRCSLPIGDGQPPTLVRDTLVLWLIDCEPLRDAKAWRPALVVDDPIDSPSRRP